MNLDSSNIDNIQTFAFFLAQQNKKYEAITCFEKAFVLAQTSESKAIILSALGSLYHNNQKMPQAEAAFLEALNIGRQLVEKNLMHSRNMWLKP